MKRFLCSLLIVMCAVGMIQFNNVKAANTEDTDFLYYVDSDTKPTIPKRQKTNSSSIFVITKENSVKYVKVAGERLSSDGTWVNETVGSKYAILKRRIKSSLKTNIYEHRGSVSKPYARLRFKMYDGEEGHVWGYWSPDSTQKYTVLN